MFQFAIDESQVFAPTSISLTDDSPSIEKDHAELSWLALDIRISTSFPQGSPPIMSVMEHSPMDSGKAHSTPSKIGKRATE